MKPFIRGWVEAEGQLPLTPFKGEGLLLVNGSFCVN